jgi:hypothetical protein
MSNDWLTSQLKLDVDKWAAQSRGQLALYMENPTRIIVRIHRIEIDGEGVTLQLIHVPTLGVPPIPKALLKVWSSWESLSCDAQSLSARYVPWRVHVDLDLTIQIIALARKRAEQGKELAYIEMSYPVAGMPVDKLMNSPSPY